MAFREVPMFEIREVLRLWLTGEGLRAIARLARVDRKTVRRYVAAAEAAGAGADGGEGQLTDALIGAVCEAVRPARPGGHGAAWAALVPHEELIGGWVKAGLRLTKIADLLGRRGVRVPYRTLHRFAVERCGVRPAGSGDTAGGRRRAGRRAAGRLRAHGPAVRPRRRAAPGGVGADLHRCL
jgi:hypothetical protein